MKIGLFISMILSWALMCQSGGSDVARPEEMAGGRATLPSMEESDQSYGGTGRDQEIQTEQKIIRDGRMSVDVDQMESAREFVQSVIQKYKARVSGEHLDNNDYQTTYTLRIRVSASRLDSLVSDLETIDGNVTSKSIDARDVTEEFIDLETRLENKRSYLNQYREILKSAKTTEDILKVSEHIRQLEEEIESAEGRLRYLSDQVALSTLELQLMHRKEFVYKPDRRIDFFERLKESISDGWYGFVSFLLVLVRLWPFVLLLIAFLWWLIRRGKQKSVQKKVGQDNKAL